MFQFFFSPTQCCVKLSLCISGCEKRHSADKQRLCYKGPRQTAWPAKRPWHVLRVAGPQTIVLLLLHAHMHTNTHTLASPISSSVTGILVSPRSDPVLLHLLLTDIRWISCQHESVNRSVYFQSFACSELRVVL